MNIFYFAATESAASESPLVALGIDLRSFIFQLITFSLIFLILKKFAFKTIGEKLAERRQVIDDGVRMGLKMEKEKEKLDAQVAAALKDARHEADQIIANAHKEAREVIRDAEKAAITKANALLADAEVRMHEETKQSRKKLEGELAGLVSEATEAIVGEKIDSKRDTELVKKAMKAQST